MPSLFYLCLYVCLFFLCLSVCRSISLCLSLSLYVFLCSLSVCLSPSLAVSVSVCFLSVTHELLLLYMYNVVHLQISSVSEPADQIPGRTTSLAFLLLFRGYQEAFYKRPDTYMDLHTYNYAFHVLLEIAIHIVRPSSSLSVCKFF